MYNVSCMCMGKIFALISYLIACLLPNFRCLAAHSSMFHLQGIQPRRRSSPRLVGSRRWVCLPSTRRSSSSCTPMNHTLDDWCTYCSNPAWLVCLGTHWHAAPHSQASCPCVLRTVDAHCTCTRIHSCPSCGSGTGFVHMCQCFGRTLAYPCACDGVLRRASKTHRDPCTLALCHNHGTCPRLPSHMTVSSDSYPAA